MTIKATTTTAMRTMTPARISISGMVPDSPSNTATYARSWMYPVISPFSTVDEMVWLLPSSEYVLISG